MILVVDVGVGVDKEMQKGGRERLAENKERKE